jgi:hypothetical protein
MHQNATRLAAFLSQTKLIKLILRWWLFKKNLGDLKLTLDNSQKGL